MELTILFGYFSAIFVGLVLGLTGSGGSILTVPIMVYLLQVDPILATAYSLFVVGFTSMVGTVSYMKQGLVSYRTAFVFALPSFLSVFLTRKFIMPSLPQTILTIGNFQLDKNVFVMLFFAVLMVLASYSMIKGSKKIHHNEEEPSYLAIIFQGIFVGLITGFVGAGGGFIIIPALVIMGKLDMKIAVGTSLFIITINSLFGFLGDLGQQSIDWVFLGYFSILAAFGIILGSYLTRFISVARLKPAFGWFILLMGFYIIGKEILTA